MRIFLSYRRDDASPWAGRLSDALADHFGDGNIFLDVTTVNPGDNFRDAIDSALAQTDVTLALIGPDWLTVAAPDGVPRLMKPDDYVRFELTAAIEQGRRLIPVLVGGAGMPLDTDLPEGLEPLGLRQAVALHDASWRHDVEGLVRSLRGKASTIHRRRWVLGAALAAGLIMLAGAVWLISLDSENGGTEGGSSSAPRSVAEAPGSCEPPGSAGWTAFVATGAAQLPVSGTRFELTEGHVKRESSGWRVVLRTVFVNEFGGRQYHDSHFYKLIVGSATFEPYCFDVVSGQDLVDPGGTSEALVGFETTVDPTEGLSFDLGGYGENARIDLLPIATG